MQVLATLVMTCLVFLLVGPLIGGVIIFIPGGLNPLLFLASYLFGAIPATIAGLAYGGVRLRYGDSVRRRTRALWGAGAGLVGATLFYLYLASRGQSGVSVLLTVAAAAVPAGAVCAVLLRGRRSARYEPGC